MHHLICVSSSLINLKTSVRQGVTRLSWKSELPWFAFCFSSVLVVCSLSTSVFPICNVGKTIYLPCRVVVKIPAKECMRDALHSQKSTQAMCFLLIKLYNHDCQLLWSATQSVISGESFCLGGRASKRNIIKRKKFLLAPFPKRGRSQQPQCCWEPWSIKFQMRRQVYLPAWHWQLDTVIQETEHTL